MKKKCFGGVAVHPARVEPNTITKVGVWIGRRISVQQREEILKLNEICATVRIGVHVGHTETTVTYLKRVGDAKAARRMATALARRVSEITGVTAILRQLPNYRAVSRALAI